MKPFKTTISHIARLILWAIAIAGACGVVAQLNEPVPPVFHSKIGDKAASRHGEVKLAVTGQKLNYVGCNKALRDTDVYSPKSAHFHPDGTKYYINSLEGCMTIVYDAATGQKLHVIKHKFTDANAYLWAKPSGLYHFTHYSKHLNTFWGRPVESAFSHKGRYLWIPYYRRSYDLNAQDPSAISVVDTRADTIVRVMETGPLPKMVAASHNGKYMAVTHWGDNTVGLIDISSRRPVDWHWATCITVDHKLKLNFSTTTKVDRDSHSGYLLRGTVFTPDDRYLLVGCMGGVGGIAVIDVQQLKYLGRLTGVYNARHLVIDHGYLYASLNAAGIVQRLALDTVLDAVRRLGVRKTAVLKGWQACRVGRGARTISLSPSGNYLYAACNAASELCVVDTRTMKQVASLHLDSYPVGLDISADGRHVVVTSQGRKGHGGNAVNLVTVDYATPEPNLLLAKAAATSPVAATGAGKLAQTKAAVEKAVKMPVGQCLTLLLGVVLVVLIVVLLKVVNRHSHDKAPHAD